MKSTIPKASTSPINQVVYDELTKLNLSKSKILDIGAGKGFMSKWIGDTLEQQGVEPRKNLIACDLYPDHFAYDKIECRLLNANSSFPFKDAEFDIVYAIEVIEHLFNPLLFLQEVFRICKPGAVVIFTTPNILNLNSRINYFINGFFALFDPLSYDSGSEKATAGHVLPLNYYYWVYFMKRAGFSNVEMRIDRIKRSGIFYFLLSFPIIHFATKYMIKKAGRHSEKRRTDNEHYIRRMNSFKLLTSRTCIFVLQK